MSDEQKILPSYVMFWKTSDKYGFLSQWYKSSFIDGDINFNCVAQYIVYQKAKLFNDINIAISIIKEIKLNNIKHLEQQIKNFNEEHWKKHREEILKNALRLKFNQNKKLKHKLLRHGPHILFVEANPTDSIWGIGFTEQKAISNFNKWGENLLGKILTDIKNEMLLMEHRSI